MDIVRNLLHLIRGYQNYGIELSHSLLYEEGSNTTGQVVDTVGFRATPKTIPKYGRGVVFLIDAGLSFLTVVQFLVFIFMALLYLCIAILLLSNCDLIDERRPFYIKEWNKLIDKHETGLLELEFKIKLGIGFLRIEAAVLWLCAQITDPLPKNGIVTSILSRILNTIVALFLILFDAALQLAMCVWALLAHFLGLFLVVMPVVFVLLVTLLFHPWDTLVWTADKIQSYFVDTPDKIQSYFVDVESDLSIEEVILVGSDTDAIFSSGDGLQNPPNTLPSRFSFS